MKQLNEFLEAKGVSTHLKVKPSLAQAFGLPMDNGTEEQQRDLLRALEVGSMALTGTVKESLRVEVATFKGEEENYTCNDMEEVYKKCKELAALHKTYRTVQTTVISAVL